MKAIRSPRWLATVVALALAAGFAGHLLLEEYRARPWAPEPDTTAPEPLGEAAYAEALAREAGAPWRPARLAAAAGSVAAEAESRLAAVARRQGADSWHRAFAPLVTRGPRTRDEILAVYRREIERARAFVGARELVTLPAAPLEVVAVANPGISENHPLAIYLDRKLGVVPELGRHCAACVPPLAVHEGYPGHHTAFEAARAGSAAGESAEGPRFFVEGWALYAELLMLAEGYYADPGEELAAWRMVLLRAVRAEVDIRLHVGTLTPEAARALYRDRLLLDDDAAGVEVHGHLERPTAKASYLGGALQILALRDQLERESSTPPFDRRAFHDRLLERPRTLPEIARAEFGVDPLVVDRPALPRPSATPRR